MYILFNSLYNIHYTFSSLSCFSISLISSLFHDLYPVFFGRLYFISILDSVHCVMLTVHVFVA